MSFARLFALDGQQPVYPRSLVELAYEQLLSMLVTMKIPPGAHMGIEALARELQISQTPVREALTLLEAQKLAYKIPNVGFRAANLLSRQEINDLYALRLLIEPRAAALAAEKSSDATLEALTRLAEEMAGIAASNDTGYTRFAEGDAWLHHLVATASGNRFISEAVAGLNVHLHIFRFLFETDATEGAMREHSVLIEALLARDPSAAEEAMRVHLQASCDRMNLVMDQREQRAGDADAPAGDAQTPRGPGQARRTEAGPMAAD
jgi:DNA-binding GntR family transcriptional regulator